MPKIRCKKLAKKYQGTECIICQRTETTIGEHILTVGSRPDLAKDTTNIWSLCYDHHKEKEDGLRRFVKTYGLEDEMLSRGFFFADNKWKRKDLSYK